MSTMKALRPPLAASSVAYLVRFRCPRDSSAVRARCCRRSRAGGGPASSQDHCSTGDPRSRIPAESAAPRHRETVPSMMPPQHRTRRLQRTFISRPPRGFSTCCLRFKNDVATIPARLASGWLASRYREGVEPSGPRWKVSELLHLFPPSWIYPDATASETRHKERRERSPDQAVFPGLLLHQKRTRCGPHGPASATRASRVPDCKGSGEVPNCGWQRLNSVPALRRRGDVALCLCWSARLCNAAAECGSSIELPPSRVTFQGQHTTENKYCDAQWTVFDDW